MNQNSKDLAIIQRTKKWVEEVVIGQNFCPFAKSVFNHDLIKYSVSVARTEEEAIIDLGLEMRELNQTDPQLLDTTLLILPNVLGDFNNYNSFLKVVDEVLFTQKLEADLQVASFHPQYQFSKTRPQDLTNLTNQSPFPILHLLRAKSVSKAVESHPNPELIYQQNIKKILEMSSQQVKALKKLIHGK